jgi:DMSO reductase anchor subunit
MELVQPKKQHVWDWPVVVNFTLGGMAAGFYLLNFLLKTFQGNMPDRYQTVVFKLLPPILVGLGFISLTGEAGRSLRGRYLLGNLHSSWMSRETLMGALFILSAGLDFLSPHVIFKISALLAAAGLIISHGFIVYRAVAVKSWNDPLIPLHFVTSGLSMGVGLTLLLGGCSNITFGPPSILTGIICILLNLIVWLTYRYLQGDIFFLSTSGSPVSSMLTLGIGHLLPVVLLLLHVLMPAAETKGTFQDILSALAGLAILAGGVGQKVVILLGDNYLRGIMMGQPKGSRQGV